MTVVIGDHSRLTSGQVERPVALKTFVVAVKLPKDLLDPSF